MSYAELVAAVEALAAALQSIDAAPGSRVGICAKNTREHLIALLATYAAGKVWVPLNPRNGRAELDAMIAATCPSLVVADASCVDRFSPTSAPLVIAKTDERVDSSVTRPDRARGSATSRHRSSDATTTSRSSSSAAEAPARRRQSCSPVRTLDAQARGLFDAFDFDTADVNLIAAPLTHGASCFVLPILAAGGRHVMLEDPKPTHHPRRVRIVWCDDDVRAADADLWVDG